MAATHYTSTRIVRIDARHQSYRNLMTEIFKDALLVATGGRQTSFGWDNPDRALEFLHGETAALWAELLGIDWSGFLKRIEGQNADIFKKSP